MATDQAADDKLPLYDGCPNYLYDVASFVGQLFLCGAAGGSAFHFVKGIHDSARGARLAGTVQAVRANAPRVAGNFGGYCVAFSAIEAAVSLARGGREDVWSSVSASAVTWGLHGMRRGGAPAAARCALLGVTGVGVITGFHYAAMRTPPAEAARWIRDACGSGNKKHILHN